MRVLQKYLKPQLSEMQVILEGIRNWLVYFFYAVSSNITEIKPGICILTPSVAQYIWEKKNGYICTQGKSQSRRSNKEKTKFWYETIDTQRKTTIENPPWNCHLKNNQFTRVNPHP